MHNMTILSKSNWTATIGCKTQEPQNLAGQRRGGAVDKILDRWPLRTMCARLKIELPERDGVKFPSPFRPDRNPSCSIIHGKVRDWSTAENFDAIDLFAKARGITNAEAIKLLAAECGGYDAKQEARPPAKPGPVKQQLVLPELHYDKELALQVSTLRKLSPYGPQIAGASLGCLGFGTVCGFDSWVLTDAAGKIAEARRMDGQPFPPIGSLRERKAHALGGSTKSWPLGIMPPKLKAIPSDMPVVLVEGGPDYISGCDLLPHAKHEFLPVAMLGTGATISYDALPLFRGREVMILAHPGKAGLDAGTRWRSQLHNAGGNPELRQLEAGDLNDLVSEHGAGAVAEDLGL